METMQKKIRLVPIVLLLLFFASPTNAKAGITSMVVSPTNAKADVMPVQWFPLVSGYSPLPIVPGANDSVWFGVYPPAIGHMNAQGCAQYYKLEKPIDGLARDKSGNIWFGISTGGIGYIDAKTHIVIAPYTGAAYNLTYTEGKIWFLAGQHSYGSISAGGKVMVYSLPQDFSANRMGAGPDGDLWITDYTHGTIGKVLPGSTLVTAYALPDNSQPGDITSGHDGALWFIDTQGVGRISTTGEVTQFNNSAVPYGDITSGPDTTLWFVAGVSGANGVAHMTTDGQVTMITDLMGRDGGGNLAHTAKFMWFTDSGGNRIGRIA